jgi:SulP family sulfate permease
MKLSKHVRKARKGLASFFWDNGLDPLPARHDLRSYRRKDLPYDLRAGLNVSLLALPQGMAYAAIAELPIVYGVTCSAVAAIVAPLFAGSRQTVLGPTNATSLMIFSFFAGNVVAADKLALMPLLCLMVGLFCVLGALLKVAELLQYVSRSVLVGYITGAATLIVANQLKHLLGVADLVPQNIGKTFIGMLEGLVGAVQKADFATFAPPLLLGVATGTCYLFMQRRFRLLPNFAFTLVLFSLLNALLANFAPALGFDHVATFDPFALSDLRPRLPDTSQMSIFDQLSTLAAVAFAVAFLASLENTVMSKSLASRTGDRPDINQDMFSVGMANLAAGIFSGMPASGSLTRSALNADSHARTRFASIFGGLFCLVGILILAQFPILVASIPKTCLAALVVAIAISLVSKRSIQICLVSTSDDAAVLTATFLATLIAPLYVAIFIGVALSITLFLRKASKPFLVEYEVADDGDLRELGEKRKRPNPAISIVHVEGDLFFGAAEIFRTQVQRIVLDENLQVIILRLKNARHLDATSVIALEDLIKFVRSQGRHILVSGATRDVYKVLKKSGVLETLQRGANRKEGQTNLFLYHPSNPNISTRDALLRAQELLGTTEADIKIFYDPSKD